MDRGSTVRPRQAGAHHPSAKSCAPVVGNRAAVESPEFSRPVPHPRSPSLIVCGSIPGSSGPTKRAENRLIARTALSMHKTSLLFPALPVVSGDAFRCFRSRGGAFAHLEAALAIPTGEISISESIAKRNGSVGCGPPQTHIIGADYPPLYCELPVCAHFTSKPWGKNKKEKKKPAPREPTLLENSGETSRPRPGCGSRRPHCCCTLSAI